MFPERQKQCQFRQSFYQMGHINDVSAISRFCIVQCSSTTSVQQRVGNGWRPINVLSDNFGYGNGMKEYRVLRTFAVHRCVLCWPDRRLFWIKIKLLDLKIYECGNPTCLRMHAEWIIPQLTDRIRFVALSSFSRQRSKVPE